MDENRNLALHSLDIVKHWFNGGTSPVSIHEYIVEERKSPVALPTLIWEISWPMKGQEDDSYAR